MDKSKNTIAMISGVTQKVTIIAENNVGEERSISLRLNKDSKALKKLKEAWDDGMGYVAIGEIMDDDRHRRFYGMDTYLSSYQTHRLNDFFWAINNVFYNYKLSLEIED